MALGDGEGEHVVAGLDQHLELRVGGQPVAPEGVAVVVHEPDAGRERGLADVLDRDHAVLVRGVLRVGVVVAVVVVAVGEGRGRRQQRGAEQGQQGGSAQQPHHLPQRSRAHESPVPPGFSRGASGGRGGCYAMRGPRTAVSRPCGYIRPMIPVNLPWPRLRPRARAV